MRTPRPGIAVRACRRGLLALGLAGVACGMAIPGRARADGDPASDALISANVFYPYSSPVPQTDQNRLDAEVADAHRAGIDLKVAIIARESDLGSIVALYRDPQRYAEFLDTEISFQRKIPLLVVMPDGFGVEGLPALAQRRILASAAPAGSDGGQLAQAATTAIARALPAPARDGAGGRHASGPSGRLILLLALILAALLVAGVLVVLRVVSGPAGSGGNA